MIPSVLKEDPIFLLLLFLLINIRIECSRRGEEPVLGQELWFHAREEMFSPSLLQLQNPFPRHEVIHNLLAMGVVQGIWNTEKLET